MPFGIFCWHGATRARSPPASGHQYCCLLNWYEKRVIQSQINFHDMCFVCTSKLSIWQLCTWYNSGRNECDHETLKSIQAVQNYPDFGGRTFATVSFSSSRANTETLIVCREGFSKYVMISQEGAQKTKSDTAPPKHYFGPLSGEDTRPTPPLPKRHPISYVKQPFHPLSYGKKPY